MLLQFISEPTIGARERRLIRSHVMKGKNAGKPRQPKAQLIHKGSAESTGSSEEDVSENLNMRAKHKSLLYQVYWNELSSTSYPCEIGPETERFVYQRLWVITKALYPPEFCTEVVLSKYAWFQYVLSDQAYFHCLLAIASSFPIKFGGPRLTTPDALKHISQAYNMTNKRLSGPQACSDEAIAVVTMLAIYQRMHHQQAIGLVHFEGLKRMIQLRGGLAKLTIEHRALAQKPWRLALEFALQDGSAPAFGLEEIPECDHVLRPHHGTKDFDSFDLPIDPKLRAQLRAISVFTDYLNTAHTKLDPHDYSDAVCIRLHRLLDYATLNDPVGEPLSSLVHLTLVAIMTTLLPEYGQNQARYNILADRLRDALQDCAAVITDMDAETLLWAVLVGYATVLTNEEDERWLVSLGSRLFSRLGVHDWIYTHSILCRYGWIDAFYDQAGLKLLRKINEAACN